MTYWDIELRHIVDVDGQLLGIDAELITTETLLARANRPPENLVWLVRAGERHLLPQKQLLRLSPDEVLFFEISPAIDEPLHRLAA